MDKLTVKTLEEINEMAEGGKKLAEVRERTAEAIKPGMTTGEIDQIADELISKSGGKASFKMVPGYKHATCINVNEEVVHGVPGTLRVNAGDIVGVDVGLFYKGWHTDTATTVMAKGSKNETQISERRRFLDVGRNAMAAAIKQAKPGKRVWDISRAMEEAVEGAGYSVVRALTGHGIGHELHENPPIPCFAVGDYKHSVEITAGMVLAIEVMYNLGRSDVAYKNDDGWTIITADGKISGLFEQTVAVTPSGPVILTANFRKNE